ncbi:hypothetical protein C5167_007562, partial [Papaver somniferum]
MANKPDPLLSIDELEKKINALGRIINNPSILVGKVVDDARIRRQAFQALRDEKIKQRDNEIEQRNNEIEEDRRKKLAHNRGEEYLDGRRVNLQPTDHDDVFKDQVRNDCLLTKMVVDERSVIGGPKSVLVKDEDGSMTRYRRWNPYTCMLAAAILNGVEYFGITKGATVLYLGVPASAITVSHVSDIVGRDGKVYAVVYLHNSRGSKFDMARMQAFNDMAMIRENIVPIIADAADPTQYRIFVDRQVDVIISDDQRADQSTILSLNAKCYLKRKGNFAMFIKPVVMSVVMPDLDSEEDVYAHELKMLQRLELTPSAGVRLDPYQKCRACVIGRRKYKEEEKKMKMKKTLDH